MQSAFIANVYNNMEHLDVMNMGCACIQSIYQAADAPTIRCVLLQLPETNASVSTNRVETIAILY